MDTLKTDTSIGVAALAFVGTLLMSRSLVWAVVVTGLVTGFILAMFEPAVMEWTSPKLQKAWGWLMSLKRRDESDHMKPYDILLGHHPLTGQPDIENLSDLGHIGVYGTTRYGKTTWIHSIIHHLIASHAPSELRLCISDPKTVDYPFYGRLPYLLCPIARNAEETGLMIDVVIGEMERRIALFTPFSRRSVCNNLDRYTELSGHKLPRVLVIFDELADVVEPGSVLESNLIRLAKLGLAYGIHLICATQRPSSKVVTGEIKSQMASKFVTWMPTSREYGVVAELPKEMYQEMPRAKGRFMAYSAKGWRYVQGRKVPDRELERLAAGRAGKQREWKKDTGVTETAVSTWDGDDTDKARMIQNFAAELGRKPSISETMTRFGISKPTAVKYLKMAVYSEGVK